MLQTLDEAAVREWARRACDALAEQRGEIDRINVFPVADGDTGSNLYATMRAGLDALADAPVGGGRGACAEALARGALRGAKGNSGVILSQLLRGLAEGLQLDVPDAPSPLVEGLRRAAELATAAVSEPVAGTILTVLQDAAAAAAQTAGGAAATTAAVVDAAADAAARSLAATPGLLPQLARAGVVDAGARGVVVLLDALAEVLTGRPGSVHGAAPSTDLVIAAGCESSAYAYEVMYLLEGCADAEPLRTGLLGLGDCVVVAGSGGADPLWSVHVHCSDVGAAIEAGLGHGRPSRITVLRFADQQATPSRPTGARSVLCVARGAGVAELLAESGGVVVPVDGLEAAVAAAADPELIVLVDGADVERARLIAGAAAGRNVVVIPTASPVQMLAALAVHDPGRRIADDLVAMAATGAATRCARLEIATQEALTWAGRCQAGDHLGVVDGDVVLVEPVATTAAVRLVERMLSAGGELVTVLLGSGVSPDVGAGLEEHVRAEHPEVELAIYNGGQPDCVLLMGVE